MRGLRGCRQGFAASRLDGEVNATWVRPMVRAKPRVRRYDATGWLRVTGEWASP